MSEMWRKIIFKYIFCLFVCLDFDISVPIKLKKSKPPIPPTTTEQPIKTLIPQLLNTNERIKLKGAIFCHVNKIAWLAQLRFSAMLGNQKCKGAIPSFMANDNLFCYHLTSRLHNFAFDTISSHTNMVSRVGILEMIRPRIAVKARRFSLHENVSGIAFLNSRTNHHVRSSVIVRHPGRELISKRMT